MRVTIVLPAYNAATTLAKTLAAIPKGIADDIILVDDGSTDDTVAVAKSLGVTTFRHEKNMGYGGNQKTCYRKALERGADAVIMLHPDYQYDPSFIPEMVRVLKAGEADAVFGSRMMSGGALPGGMPWWKYVGNIALTRLENFMLGAHLSEYHTGFRAYTRRILEAVPFEENSNDFVFDTEIIVQLLIGRFRIREIPISTRYFPEASTIPFWASTRYGFKIIGTMLHYTLYRLHLSRPKKFLVK